MVILIIFFIWFGLGCADLLLDHQPLLFSIAIVAFFAFMLVNGSHPHIGQYPVEQTSTELQRVPKSHILSIGHHDHVRLGVLKNQSKGLIADRRVRKSWHDNIWGHIFNVSGRSHHTTHTYYVPKHVKVSDQLN